jgi:hypothetical protein
MLKSDKFYKYTYKYYVFGHYPPPCLFTKRNVSETGSCLRLEVKPTKLCPMNRASPYLWTSGHLCQPQDGVHKPNTAQTIFES